MAGVAVPQVGWGCAGDYDGYGCDEGGQDICAVVSGGDYVCDLGRNGESTAGEIWVVYSPSFCPGVTDYCAWGTDASGVGFCCAVEGSAYSLDQVVVFGSTASDNIYLTNATNDLGPWDSATFVGTVAGHEGHDTIIGSNSTSAYYQDILHGDGGGDAISGQDGDDAIFGDDDGDVLYGGAGNDAIHAGSGIDEAYGEAGVDDISGDAGPDTLGGGDGNDTIHGGAGDDTITGDDGNDAIYGGEDIDVISGESGNDTLYGEGGPDVICGDTDTNGDTLNGGSGDDQLWGATLLDLKDGGTQTGADGCDGTGINSNCENTLTSRPGLCP